MSGGADDEPADNHLPADRLAALIGFIDRLAELFAAGLDLSAARAERGLDDYDSTVYAEMLRAMVEVLREARRVNRTVPSLERVMRAPCC